MFVAYEFWLDGGIVWSIIACCLFGLFGFVIGGVVLVWFVRLDRRVVYVGCVRAWF